MKEARRHLIEACPGKIMAFTGHRPGRLPGGWNENSEGTRWIKGALLSVIQRGLDQGYRWVVVGGALGVDMWAAEAALALRKQGAYVHIALFEPHRGHGRHWTNPGLIRRHQVIRKAAKFIHAPDIGYSPAAMHQRNERMVDVSDLLIGIWDEKKGGGTYQCIEYARRKERPRIYIYNPWKRMGRTVKSAVRSQEREDNQ